MFAVKEPVDIITRSVIQHRLSAIVEEIGEAMLKTSYSQILNASRDFSVGILDKYCRLISQADHIPIHVGALTWAVKAVEERFTGDINHGDIFILNDPYCGGSHLPDVTIFIPIFFENERYLWTVVRAHMGDIGGATYGGYNPSAREIWQEGLRIPPMKLSERGVLRDDVFDMILLNVRFPRDFRGDLMAMIGAAKLGELSVHKLFKEFTASNLTASVEAMLNAAEERARNIVSAWQDGEYTGIALLDDDGCGREDIAIRARVTVKGSELTIDLTESDPQSASFTNSSLANSHAAVAMAFAYLIDADIPKNEGTFRVINTLLKPGTVVCAEQPAPVTMSTTHPANEIVEAIVRALAPACPDRVMGGWGRRFRISLTGDNPRTKKPFVWHMFHARPGGGASPEGDGWSGAGEWHSVGGIKFGSVEVTEARFPLLFERHEFWEGSGGDGQYRGGLGSAMNLRVEVDATAHTAGEGIRHGAAGMLGGEDGQPHRYALISGNHTTLLPTKAFGLQVRESDLLEIRAGGGGGWGRASDRTEEAKKNDLLNRYVVEYLHDQHQGETK